MSKLMLSKFFRKKVPCKNSENIELQIIEWWANDELNESNCESSEDSENDKCKYCNNSPDYCRCILDEYTIRCFGRTADGVSVTCKINNFRPYYYIKVDSSFTQIKLQKLLKYMESTYFLKNYPKALLKENGRHKSCLVEKKDLFGFRNGKIYKYVKLIFTNWEALKKSRYIFKKPLHISEVTKKATKFKLYESNFEGFMRYCHIKDIYTAGWIQLPAGKYHVTSDTSYTQMEVEIDKKYVVSLKSKQEMAPFLQASWDIEVYSYDYTFPDPCKKQNEIFQIATTYKYYGDSNTLVKHLLTLKQCAPINDSNVIVEECKNEKELIMKWVDTISKMDPDIFYTYNGDSFDCIYLLERAILHGLAFKDNRTKRINRGYIVENLSRLTDIPCDLRKEYFSSSAYGDSEFHRLYIPGRLNYDLLIHYKRGMKKYPSYKLDYIANEILKEGKHDVSAKEIFGYYEQGTPEKIRSIGEYCIQDTELLQKLVDKQLILTNIIQLANVTYVPIGYLTTKGQTIKVFSQLLRKARQMDFLVPHTNFNEDSFPIFVKLKEPHSFDECDVGEYVEIDLGLNETIGKRQNINCRISEIIDDTNIIILTDTEISKEYYNRRLKYKHQDYICSRIWPNDDAIDDSFTGATVLDPKPGWYATDNIAVLDFASLYPTVEISRNLCYSTLVMDERYLNLSNVKYETIEWNDSVEYKLKQTCQGVGKSGKSKGQVCGKQAFFEVKCNSSKCTMCTDVCKIESDKNTDVIHYYCRIHDPLKKERDAQDKCQKKDVTYKYIIVQPHKNESGEIINKGVIPALLEELYSERKRVKREMAQAQQDGNKLLADILDSTQLAIKVSLNSVYGFVSRGQGNLICKPLGQLTTAIGRMLIEQSKEYAEGKFLDYVRDKQLVKHKIELSNVNISHLSTDEKQNILNKFKIKNNE
jgi:DNA polymerase elongation subunit (family B)